MSKPALKYLILIIVALTGLLLSPSSSRAESPNEKGSSGDSSPEEQIFRPQRGQFPPVHLGHTYRGELVFVDHANRRGSLRVEGSGMFFRNDPHPFALLPYAEVRYRNAPADLKDIPLGTVLRVTAYLPPDPKLSSVPVLPVDNRERDANHNRGAGIFPAENHVLLLEDEPSYCQRTNSKWQLNTIQVKQDHGTLQATHLSETQPNSNAAPEALTFDSATRIWRGRERLTFREWVDENEWEENQEIALADLSVQLGIAWKPTANGVFTRFHLSDIWLDELSMQRSSDLQLETHKQFIRARWMPAWVDAVEYGEFGQATVTATLFGGMAPSLYEDFKAEDGAMMNPVEATLKHTHGAYGPAHMACRGPILEVIRSESAPPRGSSGIQIRFKTDLIIEGIRPGNVVRVRPAAWPLVNLPREEYLNDGSSISEERFPTPAIFPKY